MSAADQSARLPSTRPTCLQAAMTDERVMARADDQARPARHDATDELCGVDLILECERAASRRNPRDRDPKRWTKTAWRRYLYTAAHAPSLVDLERIFGR